MRNGARPSALFGMGAPKKMPPEIIEKLNREVNAVLAELEKWEKVVKFSGAKVE